MGPDLGYCFDCDRLTCPTAGGYLLESDVDGEPAAWLGRASRQLAVAGL